MTWLECTKRRSSRARLALKSYASATKHGQENKMSIVTVDLTLVQGLIDKAVAIGFPGTLGLDVLADLGGQLNADDALFAIIDANWQLEIRAPGPSPHPQVIWLATLRSLPECDRALYRNRALARVAAEKRQAPHTNLE
jgi:hypothetical protein